ncbi:hypothetical protein BpHYR1_050972 [Brachionus plicatilis]|uniref:Uncharacterized protein n=1 Tax=Brachionus plicatilis TaxID=10195 RepID=A0A3M7QXZ9_BRAPC|nr:hypothetical protein BpHYR1_050972 [Brachionus plicatilis]
MSGDDIQLQALKFETMLDQSEFKAKTLYLISKLSTQKTITEDNVESDSDIEEISKSEKISISRFAKSAKSVQINSTFKLSANLQNSHRFCRLLQKVKQHLFHIVSFTEQVFDTKSKSFVYNIHNALNQKSFCPSFLMGFRYNEFRYNEQKISARLARYIGVRLCLIISKLDSSLKLISHFRTTHTEPNM